MSERENAGLGALDFKTIQSGNGNCDEIVLFPLLIVYKLSWFIICETMEEVSEQTRVITKEAFSGKMFHKKFCPVTVF